MGKLQKYWFYTLGAVFAFIIVLSVSYVFSMLKVQENLARKEVEAAANIRFDTLQDSIEQKLDQVASMATSMETAILFDSINKAFSYSAKSHAYGESSRQGIDRLRFFAGLSNANDVFLINLNGDVVLSLKQNPPFDHNLFDSIFQNTGLAKATKEVFSGSVHAASPFEIRADFGPKLTSLQNIPTAFFVAPIYRQDEIIGALALQAWPENLYTIAGNWRDIAPGGVIAVFAYNDKNIVMLNSLEPIFPLRSGERIPHSFFKADGTVSEILKGASGIHIVNDVFDGLPRLDAYRSLPEMKLGFFVSVPMSSILQRTFAVLKFDMALFAVFLCLLLLSFYWLFRRQKLMYRSAMSSLKLAFDQGKPPVFSTSLRDSYKEAFSLIDGIFHNLDGQSKQHSKSLVAIQKQEHAQVLLFEAIFIKSYHALEFAWQRNKSLLNNIDLQDQVSETLDESQHQIKQTMSFLEDARDLQKIIAQDISLEYQRCNFIVFMTSVEEEYAMVAASSAGSFKITLPPSMPEAIITDVRRLSNVFSIVIDYAFALSKSTSVTMLVELVSRTSDKAKFKFQISSIDGVLPGDLISLLGNNFSIHLVDNLMSNFSDNLNLALCKGILASMHGDLLAKNSDYAAHFDLEIEFNLA